MLEVVPNETPSKQRMSVVGVVAKLSRRMFVVVDERVVERSFLFKPSLAGQTSTMCVLALSKGFGFLEKLIVAQRGVITSHHFKFPVVGMEPVICAFFVFFPHCFGCFAIGHENSALFLNDGRIESSTLPRLEHFHLLLIDFVAVLVVLIFIFNVHVVDMVLFNVIILIVIFFYRGSLRCLQCLDSSKQASDGAHLVFCTL